MRAQKLAVITALLAGLIFATGCASTKAPKKSAEKEERTEKKPPESEQKVPTLPGSKMKHNFDGYTAYIVITEKTLTVVTKKPGNGRVDCTSTKNVVDWTGNKARFPKGTKWTFTKVSDTEMEVTFPPSDASMTEKIVRYEKTDNKVLKGCDNIKNVKPKKKGKGPKRNI